MSSGLYNHTTRGVGTVLTAAIYNADHQNHITNFNPSMEGAYSDNVSQMQDTDTPGGVGTESLATNMAGELARLRFMIQSIVGGAQWYSAPTATLDDLAGGEFDSLTVAKSVQFTGVLSPTQLAANTNNYAPTGHADALRFRISSDASRNLTGLAGGTAGRIVSLVNIGTQNIVLKNQDANSTDTNRFLLSGDVTLKPDHVVALQYDSTTQRWRPFDQVRFDNQGIVGNLDVAGATTLVDLSQTGFHQMTEMAAPSAPAANSVRVYCRDIDAVSDLFMKRSDGSERILGGPDLIATLTPTSGTAANFTGLITTPYSRLLLHYDGVHPNGNAVPTIGLSDDAATSFEDLISFVHSSSSGDAVTRADDETVTAQQRIARGDMQNGQTDMFGIVEIFLPGLAATRKQGRANMGWGVGGSWDTNIAQFASVSMNAINYIRCSWTAAAEFSGGTIKLFGIR